MRARFSAVVSRNGGFRATFATVVIVFGAAVIALAAFLSTKISEQNVQVALTARERQGLAYTTRILETVRALRLLRDRITFDHNAGAAQRREVKRDLDNLVSFDHASGRAFALTARVGALEAELAAMPRGVSGTDAIATLVASAASLSDAAGDRSILLADPDGPTAALIDAYMTNLTAVAGSIDEEKLLLHRAELSGQFLPRDQVAADAYVVAARQALLSAREEVDNARFRLDNLSTAYGQISAIGDSLAVFSTVLDRAHVSTVTARADNENLRSLADSVIDAVDLAYVDLSDRIDASLSQRQTSAQQTLFFLHAAVVLSIELEVVAVLFLCRLVRRRQLSELARSREKLLRLQTELEQQRRIETLAVTEAHFRAAFDRSASGVVILDRAGTVLRTNARILEMMDPIDADVIGTRSSEYARLFTGEIDSFTTETYREASDTWFETSVSLVRDGDQTPRFALSMIKDVTERKKLAARFRYEALHDSLSGLPNRTYFNEHLQGRLDAPYSGVRAVLFIDIDEFKLVNDSYGHSAGDRVIAWCAEQLRANVSSDDFVARLGGDEFVALVNASERSDVEETTRRLSDALCEKLVIDGHEIFVTVSIGIAFVDRGSGTTDDILRDADTAMYLSKTNGGRVRFAVFDPAMREDVSRRTTLSLELRRALERGQLFLVYQPVVSLVTGAIDSFETLLRWDHPELGMVSPVEFIPLAEELDLIVPIGRYVLDGACAQFAEWKRDFPRHRPRRVAVNASVREISQVDYVEWVGETLARHGMAPAELVLEVTESAVLSSKHSSGGPLERLKAIGVGLAIDDFGTGFSSLRYLQQFPFDVLKIDRSFVGGDDGRLANEPIVAMLLSLARACGVTVTAEGVETAAQAARLRELGCADAQGYYFGRPTRAADVPALFYCLPALAS